MSAVSAFLRMMLILLCSLGWDSCSPHPGGVLDEQRDPNYLAAKNKASRRDFKGAVADYEKALEANPRSGSAHYELGWLYEQNLGDFAAAIYHFQRFRLLQPKSENDEIVRQHILACKHELAKTGTLNPIAPSLTKDYERLQAENRSLRQQVETWMRLATNRPPAPAPVPVAALPATNPVSPRTAFNPPAPAPAPNPRPSSAGAPRTHVIRSGETLSAIAQKYGVKLSALQKANPRLNPRRLPVGRTLTIPAP